MSEQRNDGPVDSPVDGPVETPFDGQVDDEVAAPPARTADAMDHDAGPEGQDEDQDQDQDQDQHQDEDQDQEQDQDEDQDDDTGDVEGDPEEEESRPTRRKRLEQEGEIAADYLEELLEIVDLDGDLDMDVEGDRATVSIVGANLPQLVGDQGEVLEALQELTRLAVFRETGERSRLMLDISGHRAQRRTALEEQAEKIVAQVKETGEQATLEPMSPFERKVVHDVVSAAGLTSESEGAEPRRYVVVLPA